MKERHIESKTNNLREHLLVVKGDIDRHVTILSGLNESIKAGETTLINQSNRSAELSIEIKNKEEMIEAFDKREKHIMVAEGICRDKIAKIQKQETELGSKIAQEDTEFQKVLRAHERELNLAEVNFERFTRGCMEDTIKIKEEIARLETEHDGVLQKLVDVRNELQKTLGNCEHSIQELKSLQSEIAKAKYDLENQKLESATHLKNIEERELAVKTKESDLMVLAARIKRKHKLVYPHLDINI